MEEIDWRAFLPKDTAVFSEQNLSESNNEWHSQRKYLFISKIT